MIRNARTAVKFFVYGLIVGLLFSPGSGSENRQKLIDWVSGSVKEVVG